MCVGPAETGIALILIDFHYDCNDHPSELFSSGLIFANFSKKKKPRTPCCRVYVCGACWDWDCTDYTTRSPASPDSAGGDDEGTTMAIIIWMARVVIVKMLF